MWAVLTNPDEYIDSSATKIDLLRYTIYMADVNSLVQQLVQGRDLKATPFPLSDQTKAFKDLS